MIGCCNCQKKADKGKRHRKNSMRKSNKGKVFFHFEMETNLDWADKLERLLH